MSILQTVLQYMPFVYCMYYRYKIIVDTSYINIIINYYYTSNTICEFYFKTQNFKPHFISQENQNLLHLSCIQTSTLTSRI